MINSKNKDPAFLFYSSDFLSGCANLTMEERGQFITAMCLQHQHGHLSERLIELNIGKMSPELSKKFLTDENSCLYNERLEDVIEKRKIFTESRRQNALKRRTNKKASV